MTRPSGNCGGLGVLLKHHFEVVKRTGNPAALAELDAALREIRRAIEVLSERRDCQKGSNVQLQKCPKSVMIGGLVDYILAEHDDRGKDKLSYAGSRNFLTTTVAAQKREMISLAEESIQSKIAGHALDSVMAGKRTADQ